MLKKLFTGLVCLIMISCTILLCTHIRPERTPGNILGNAVDHTIEEVQRFSTDTTRQIREGAESLWGQIFGK